MHASEKIGNRKCILKGESIQYFISSPDWQRPLTKTSHFYRLCPKRPGSYYSSAERAAQSIKFLLVERSGCVKPVHTQRVRARQAVETWELCEGHGEDRRTRPAPVENPGKWFASGAGRDRWGGMNGGWHSLYGQNTTLGSSKKEKDKKKTGFGVLC